MGFPRISAQRTNLALAIMLLTEFCHLHTLECISVGALMCGSLHHSFSKSRTSGLPLPSLLPFQTPAVPGPPPGTLSLRLAFFYFPR